MSKGAKLIGKHSLTHDVIFNGKREKEKEKYESEHIIDSNGGSLDISEDFINENELLSEVDYYKINKMRKDILNIIKEKTDINILAPRRKPSKEVFNDIFELIVTELQYDGNSYTNIFIELSSYFSDKIWNIFLLLNNKYSNAIISELKDKYGLTDIDKITFV